MKKSAKKAFRRCFYTGADDDSRMRCLCGKSLRSSSPTSILRSTLLTASAPTVCFRNNSNKTIKYVTFTLVPLNAVGDRTSCTISGRSAVTAQVVGPIAPTRFDRTVANTVTSPASMGDFGPFQAQQQLATNYYFGAEERNGHRTFFGQGR